MRTMWDGINSDAATIAKICKPGDLIAYYIDGNFAWTPQEIALFKGHPMVTITVNGSHSADIVDSETGDVSETGAASWVEDQIKNGYARPTVYHSLSGIEKIRNATGANILQKNYDIWVADYDNKTASVYSGSAAKQFKNSAFYDESEVYDDLWPHRTVTAIVAPVNAPKWPAGQVLREGNTGNAVLALQKALNKVDVRGIRNIGEDGIFGTQVLTAVKNFEAHFNVANSKLANGEWDGIAGSAVRSTMVVHGYLNTAGQA